MVADPNGAVPEIQDSNSGSFKTSFLYHFLNQIQSWRVILRCHPLVYSIPLLLLLLSLISIITRVVQFLLKPFGQPFIVSQILVSLVLSLLCLCCLFFNHFCFCRISCNEMVLVFSPGQRRFVTFGQTVSSLRAYFYHF